MTLVSVNSFVLHARLYSSIPSIRLTRLIIRLGVHPSHCTSHKYHFVNTQSKYEERCWRKLPISDKKPPPLRCCKLLSILSTVNQWLTHLPVPDFGYWALLAVARGLPINSWTYPRSFAARQTQWIMQPTENVSALPAVFARNYPWSIQRRRTRARVQFATQANSKRPKKKPDFHDRAATTTPTTIAWNLITPSFSRIRPLFHLAQR